MKSLEIKFYVESGCDLRASVPGYGTGLLDVLRKERRVKMTGYDQFLLVWQIVAAQLRLLKDVYHPMVTDERPRGRACVRGGCNGTHATKSSPCDRCGQKSPC